MLKPASETLAPSCKRVSLEGENTVRQLGFDDVLAYVAFGRLVRQERAVGHDEAGGAAGRQVPAKLDAVLGLLKDGGRG
jgi:hypothetical protein